MPKEKDCFHVILSSSSCFHYHDNCYLTYTSNNHIEWYPKRTNQQEPDPSNVNRSRRSLTGAFNFKKNCLIWGESCNVAKEKKHPDRGKGDLSFKEVLFQVININFLCPEYFFLSF